MMVAAMTALMLALSFALAVRAGYGFGRRMRLRAEHARLLGLLRYPEDDPGETRGKLSIRWHIVCQRCCKTADLDARIVQKGPHSYSYFYGPNPPCQDDVVALGFESYAGLWYCRDCAADVRAYARDRLA